jgi:catechol 2,3-dioxygenase-like lactoylglutathione lyase family enzyme
MLGDTEAIATIAVKDLAAARTFYRDKLGLQEAASEEKMVLTFKSGSSVLLVYTSEFAGTNEATAATWAVDDVAAVVGELKANGVVFEHYDFPGMTLEGDVHVSGKRKVAWCKDPDGNILSIVNR